MLKIRLLKIIKVTFAIFVVMIVSLIFRKAYWRERLLADFSFWNSALADDPNYQSSDSYSGFYADCGSSSSAGGTC